MEGSKNETEATTTVTTPTDSNTATSSTNAESTLQQYQEIMKNKVAHSNRVVDEEKPHLFWDTQPVPKLSEHFQEDNCPIDAEKTVAEVKQDPYTMPKGFEWVVMNVNDPVQLQEIYTLLTENYVEDDDNMFRFDYSKEFLQWALQPPGYLDEWHLGVRTTNNNKLVGFITAIPADISIHERVVPMVEINFLCVHKKIRAKRLAPVLIKEITRRVNLQNRWQAVYTAGVVIPKPVAKCRYWHRSLNPKKLYDVNFSRLGSRMTLSRAIKLYKVPEQTRYAFRPMQPEDVPAVTTLLSNYLQRTKLHPILNEHEVAHWFLPRARVICSYVLKNNDGVVTDFLSFYHLPSSIIGHPKHSTLHAAYSYYNIANTIPLIELFKDALTLAKSEQVDVYNCLDLMENKTVFEDLKFGIGDGNLQYYLYNWKCPEIEPNETGLVLL